MAAVDKTDTGPEEEPGESLVDEKIEEVKEDVAQVEAPKAPAQETPAAKEAPAAEAIQEAISEPAAEPVMFECPLCNTLVNEDASTCPGCGAIFADSEEEVPAEEAPAAEETPGAEPVQAAPEAVAPKPEVAAAAEPKPPAAQPDAAAKQREKALRKELTKCVGDVKPLLAGARQYGINVLEGRKLIDRAIAAGKKRDFENAITLVRQSQVAIEENFNQHIDDLISQIESKMGAIQKAGETWRNWVTWWTRCGPLLTARAS